MMRQNRRVDWGTWRERQQLASARRVPREERGSAKHLRANLELLWGGGSLLLTGGLLAGALGASPNGARLHAMVMGSLGVLIGLPVAIRLYLVVRGTRRSAQR